LLSEGLVSEEQAQEGKENCPPSCVGAAITHPIGVVDGRPLSGEMRRNSQEISNSDARTQLTDRPTMSYEVWGQEQVDRAVHTSAETITTQHVPLKEATSMLSSGHMLYSK
jgi:hypothetical protein